MATKTESTGQALLELLGKATAADLAEIDQQIAEHQVEIDKLWAVRKLIDVKVNGKPERKARATRKAGESKPSANGVTSIPSGASSGELMINRRKAIAKLLGKEGPQRSGVICNRLDIPSGSITGVMNSDWFNLTDNGYRLTEVGRKESGI